jgi:hypothetical protein
VSSGANGLPSEASHSGHRTLTIIGTPTVLFATFNYSIPLNGGCGTVNATGRKPSERILAVTNASAPYYV